MRFDNLSKMGGFGNLIERRENRRFSPESRVLNRIEPFRFRGPRASTMPRNRLYPRWMSTVLIFAGLYNLLWSAWVIFFPAMSFHYSGMEWPERPLTYLELWQGIGMVVGVWGLGYLLAASDPLRHWPIVLTGLLAKSFGVIGMASAAIQEKVPVDAFIMMVPNDLVWCLPFLLILLRTRQVHRNEEAMPPVEPLTKLLETRRTSNGQSLAEMSNTSPVLLVFLRHFGCPFCREAVTDLSRQRSAIQATNTQLVIVHMGEPDEANEFLGRYGMSDVPHISDPECELFRSIGLKRGTIGQILGLRSLWRGAGVFFRKGHGFGRFVGDVTRLPGVFLLDHGKVLRSFMHKSTADRPDYVTLTHCLVPTSVEQEMRSRDIA